MLIQIIALALTLDSAPLQSNTSEPQLCSVPLAPCEVEAPVPKPTCAGPFGPTEEASCPTAPAPKVAAPPRPDVPTVPTDRAWQRSF